MSQAIKIGLLLIMAISLNAYEVEKEGKWWYVYKGNDLVGAYSKWFDKYTVCCGSPKKPIAENKYISLKTNVMYRETKREAENAIINNCYKRQ